MLVFTLLRGGDLQARDGGDPLENVASMGTRTGVGKAGSNRTMLSTLPVNMAKPGLNTASETDQGQTPIMLLFVSVL